MRKVIDLSGRKYGRLTVLRQADKKNGRIAFACVCDCGVEKTITANALREGLTKSCGCLNKDRASETAQKNFTKHGATTAPQREPLYRIWMNMRDRCNNENNKVYSDYGGRGIRVCVSWSSYEVFRDYMLSLPNCPQNAAVPGSYIDLEIDRYPNNNGDYRPGNVRWATRKEQNNNQRSNRVYNVNGVNMSLAQVVERYGIVSYNTAYRRLQRGWPLKKAITQTVGGQN